MTSLVLVLVKEDRCIVSSYQINTVYTISLHEKYSKGTTDEYTYYM